MKLLDLADVLEELIFTVLPTKYRCRLACTCRTLRDLANRSLVVWQDVHASVSSAEQLQHFASWLTSRKHQVLRLHLEEFQSPNRKVAWLQWREDPLRLVAAALRRGAVLALHLTSNVERKKSKKLSLFHGRDIRLPQLQELSLCLPGLEVELDFAHLTALTKLEFLSHTYTATGSCCRLPTRERRARGPRVPPSLQDITLRVRQGGTVLLADALAPATGLRSLQLALRGEWGGMAQSGVDVSRLGRFPSLTTLSLNCSYLLNELPDGLSALTALQQLSAYCGAVAEGQGVAPLAQLAPSVTFLDLQHCRRTPAQLSALTGLRELRLRSLGSDSVDMSPLSCGLLTCLNLKWGSMPQGMPQQFSRLTALHRLELSSCHGLEKDTAPLAALQQLTSVDISWADVKALPPELEVLPHLQELLLSYNDRIQLRGLGELTALTKLDIRSCDIKGLPPSISRLHSLEQLLVEDNPNVSGLRALAHLPRLSYVDFAGCGTKLPVAFWQMPALKALTIEPRSKYGSFVEGHALKVPRPLEQLPLEELTIYFSTAAVNRLERMGMLRTLVLAHMQHTSFEECLSVTGAQVQAVLHSVLRMPNLQRLGFTLSFGELRAWSKHLVWLLDQLEARCPGLEVFDGMYLRDADGGEQLRDMEGTSDDDDVPFEQFYPKDVYWRDEEEEQQEWEGEGSGSGSWRSEGGSESEGEGSELDGEAE